MTVPQYFVKLYSLRDIVAVVGAKHGITKKLIRKAYLEKKTYQVHVAGGSKHSLPTIQLFCRISFVIDDVVYKYEELLLQRNDWPGEKVSNHTLFLNTKARHEKLLEKELALININWQPGEFISAAEAADEE